VGPEAHEEQYMTSQLSWVARDFCSAKEKPRMRSTGNPLGSSRLPKRALASQVATARSVLVIVGMQVLLLGRCEQTDLKGLGRSVK
jgi:hypothetical protein